MIKNHYPWFLDTYNNYKYKIQKIDAIRPFILYHYGGMYVDLDYECFKPFDDAIDFNKDNVYIVDLYRAHLNPSEQPDKIIEKYYHDMEYTNFAEGETRSNEISHFPSGYD